MTASPHLIVPGWGGSGVDHWQTAWERDFADGRVELGDWFEPRRDVWVAALERSVAALARPPVLVAHSLGCIVVAQWSRTTKLAARCALLVAPADLEREACPPVLRGLGPVPRYALPFSSLIVTSDDDPYISVARAEELATAWGSDLHVVHAGGHLNAASGLGAWADGRRLLARLLCRNVGDPKGT